MGILLPTNMVTAIKCMYISKTLSLLHVLLYQPENYGDLSKWVYCHCVKIFVKKVVDLDF